MLVDETTKKTNETLAKIDRTLASLKKTQEDCKATDLKFQQFQDKFQDTLNQFAVKIAEGLLPGFKANSNNETLSHPHVADIEEVSEQLIKKNNIVILTGAGISVASGIPTFRGKEGFWTVNEEKNQSTRIPN